MSHLYALEGGQLRQILLTSSSGVDPSATIEISTGNRSEQFEVRKLRQIRGQYYLPIAPLEQTETARFVLNSGGKKLETFSDVEPARKWTVFLVHNSHQDLGFIDLPSNLRSRYLGFIDDAMKYCEETRDWPEEAQFKWNIEVSYLAEDYRNARGEERFQALMDWIKKGRISIGALYCNEQTDFMSLETLHRSLYYAASDLPLKFGINLEGAILDDVPGFTWALVEVMAKSGVKYLLFGADGWRNNIQDAPIFFYLEGPEGSEVLIWRSSSYTEGMGLVPEYVDPYFGTTIRGLNIRDGEAALGPYFARYEMEKYPFDAILLQTAADFVPPQKSLSEVVRTWNSLWAYPRLRMSTLPEFFQYAEQNFKEGIPRFRGGVPDGWVDLHIAEANAAALARHTEDALPDAERLATLAGLVVGGASPTREFAQAYNEMALWEEHTFEWDNFRLHRADIYVDESQGGGKRHWEEKVAHVQTASRVAKQVEKESIEALCHALTTRADTNLVVWNPLSWRRDEIVRMPLSQLPRTPFRLRDQETGSEIPYQLDGESLVFYAEQIPALGYRAFTLEPGSPSAASKAATADHHSLENEFYKIEINAVDGTVQSLFDKELQREFVDQGAPYRFNALVYRLDRRVHTQSITEDRDYLTLATLPVEDITITPGAAGPVYSSLKVTGKVGYILDFQHEIILYKKLRRIDFYNRMQKRPIYAKESVFHAFPFSVPYEGPDTYRLDMPGAIFRPDIDQIPGSFRDTYVSQHWVSVVRKDYGVMWSSADAPLVELGDIQAEKHLHHLLIAFDNELASGGIYAYLMGNHPTVDAPVAQGGNYLFRYAMTTHGEQWALNNAHHFGWGFMSPLRVFTISGKHQGKYQEPSRAFIDLTPENVYLTGFKAAEDGEGVVLRLYEGAGLYTQARVTFNLSGRAMRTAWSCDAREEKHAALKTDRNSFELTLRPYETSTVRAVFE